MTSVKKVTPGGYMTIYLALTVTVIMALCLALIEGCRYRGISLETECVMDIGMDSILAEYHRELQKQYNLFAIDCSYGTESASTKLTESHLLEYMNRNFSLEPARRYSNPEDHRAAGLCRPQNCRIKRESPGGCRGSLSLSCTCWLL